MSTGHSEYLNAALWFQMSLFYITILFWLIGRSSPAVRRVILISLSLGCVMMQYIPVPLVKLPFVPTMAQTAIGRTMEMIPIAVVGIGIRELADDFQKKRIQNNKIVLAFIMAICVFAIAMSLYIPGGRGYGYNGFGKILMASATVFFFSNLSNLLVLPQSYLLRGIYTVEKYTLGIYCVHNLVALPYFKVQEYVGVPQGTLVDVWIIFILSFVIAYIIGRIFHGKFQRMVN